MASHAIHRRALISATNVARGAFQARMHAGEAKAGHPQVVECRAHPGIHGVTLAAIRWELQRHVIWHRLLKLPGVTTDTVGRKSLKLPRGRALMAVVALQQRVCAKQREAVLVWLECLHGHAPAFHGVALLAAGAELPPVNIGVAVGA